MREKILGLLEKDSRLTAKELAVMTGADEKAVADEIARLEGEQVICGYNTLIDWDKTNKEYVTALIEVKISPQRGQGFDAIAEGIYRFPEVTSVYLMSGGFDLTVIIEGKTIKDISFFVSGKLALLDGVLSTTTHFVLKKYKDYGKVFCESDGIDERMVVSP